MDLKNKIKWKMTQNFKRLNPKFKQNSKPKQPGLAQNCLIFNQHYNSRQLQALMSKARIKPHFSPIDC